MPLYEYRCSFCNHTTEILHKMSETPSNQCPQCQQPGLQKLVSAPRFKLKGTGWYETDFKTQKTPPQQTDSNTKTTGSNKGASTEKKSTASKEDK